MRRCEHTLVAANKPKLTHGTEFQEDAARGLKFGNVPGLNGINYRAFKHLPRSVVSLLVAL
jgi:hypothetical protein